MTLKEAAKLTKAILMALKTIYPNAEVSYNKPTSDGQNGSFNVKTNDPEYETEDALGVLKKVMDENQLDSDAEAEDPNADFGLNAYWDLKKRKGES